MKNRVSGKASKASLVARGLPSKSKPPTFKRSQKGQQKPAKESNPGYSLYTSDSEDQVSAVDRGLNRCAALLSNILDNEDKAGTSTTHGRVGSVSRPAKGTNQRVPTSQASSGPGSRAAQRTRPVGRKVVIPTARQEGRASPSPSKPHEDTNRASTAYNDRLVSSTPVLTAEERQKRQQLQRREADLQQEITKLKERYELLQRQQSPSHQTEQKLRLQNSMMQELENHQQKESSSQQHSALRHSAEMQSGKSSGSDKLPNSSPRRSSARRSLDYSGVRVQRAVGSDNSQRDGLNVSQSDVATNLAKEVRRLDNGIAKQVVDDSVTQEVDNAEVKKRVRIVSPVMTASHDIDQEPVPRSNHRENLSSSPNAHVMLPEGSKQLTPSTPSPGRLSSGYSRPRDGMSSSQNHSRMIQYLVDELRALLGNTGDLELDRLLNEIDDAAKLLPYLMEKDKTASASQDIEQAVQPYKDENAQLRRRLLIAHQKLKEGSLKKHEDKSSMKTDLEFELAACRSVNTVLQKQLTEEKNSKEEILRQRDQLSQNLGDLQEERRTFVQILSNKEQEHLRLKREWQQDTSRLTVENKRLKADLETVHLSTEAEKKEINILSLSLKQKDAEIERLKELTRGLQQSLTRLLSDIQQFQPKDLIKTGLLDKSIALDGLDKLFKSPDVRTIGQTTALRSAAADGLLTARNSAKTTAPRPSLTSVNPPALGFGDEALTRRIPSQHYVTPGKKHLRFAEEPTSHPEPTLALTSGFSQPLDKTFVGSGYGTADLDELSVHAKSLKSPKDELEVKDLEEEQFGDDLSPPSSGEEEDFRRGLENLDANIARIQKSLRETALRT